MSADGSNSWSSDVAEPPGLEDSTDGWERGRKEEKLSSLCSKSLQNYRNYSMTSMTPKTIVSSNV